MSTGIFKYSIDTNTGYHAEGEHRISAEQYGRVIAVLEGTAPVLDLEAIAWAYSKLRNFGVLDNTPENALMADRLNLMLQGDENVDG